MATLNFLAVQINLSHIAKKILVGSFTFEGFPFETLLPSCLLLLIGGPLQLPQPTITYLVKKKNCRHFPLR